ncbi:MAG: hypothetical protein OEY03_10935 [Rhizobacter sp.]|nr:hypothetical protein [Rhizobacter sp.]
MPQALATAETPIRLSDDAAKATQHLYILADGWEPSPFRHFASKFKDAAG